MPVTVDNYDNLLNTRLKILTNIVDIPVYKLLFINTHQQFANTENLTFAHK